VVDQNVPKLARLPEKIDASLPPLRIAIYGEGGVGKTSFAMTFPKPLVIDTDGGLEGDAVIVTDDGQRWMPESWRDLNALYFWLKDQIEKQGYKTIVVDSIDTLARIILHEATNLPTKTRIAGASNTELLTAEQQDYGKVALALDDFLQKLKGLSKSKKVHIILTSGVREPDLDKGRLKRTFNVQPAVEDVILYWANIYGEFEVIEKLITGGKPGEVEEVRVLWTKVSDNKRKNKTRFGVLRPGVVNPSFSKIREAIESAGGSTAQPTSKETKKQ
jgi:hypothetical protein